VPDNYVESV